MREKNIRYVVVRKTLDGTYGIVSVRDFPNDEICEFDEDLKFEANLWEQLQGLNSSGPLTSGLYPKSGDAASVQKRAFGTQMRKQKEPINTS